MRKTVTSLVALGVGAALYQQARKGNLDVRGLVNNPTMKRMQRRIQRTMQSL